MATPNMSAADLAELEKKIKRIEELSGKFKANINTLNLQPLEENAGAIEAIWESLEDRLEQAGKKTDYLVGSFKDLVDEIKNSKSGLADSTKSLKSLSNISEQLVNHQKGYNELSSKDLSKLQDKVKIERERLVSTSQRLKDEADELTLQTNSNNFTRMGVKEQQKLLDKLDQTKAAQESINNLLSVQDVTLADLNTGLNEELKSTKELEKRLGIVGGVLKGISKIPIIGDLVDTERALKAMKEAGGGIAGLKAGIKDMGSQFMESVTNPANIALFVITQIGEALKGADKGAGDLAKGFNMTYNEAMGVREELTQMGNLSGDVALNTRALQESMMAVGQALGSNAMLNEKDLVTFTKLREQAGFTNDELLGIEKTTLATGGNLEKNAKNILFSAKLTGLNNKVLLNEKDIMRDVAKASDAIKLSLGGSGKKLGEAAAQAKSLGMSLEQVDKIAGSLLDFESSITNELSAELITGKQLNLEQARLYALNNDMAGLSREIAKNFGSVAEYSKMNRIQQEAAAKAVGMSREELATTLTDQAALKGLSGDKLKDAQAALDYARAQGMTEDQIADKSIEDLMKQQSVQDRLNQSVEKLKEIFVSIAEPIMRIVSPLVDMITTILPAINLLLTPVNFIFKSIADAVQGFTNLIHGDLKDGLGGVLQIAQSIAVVWGGIVLGAKLLGKETLKNISLQGIFGNLLKKDFWKSLGTAIASIFTGSSILGPFGIPIAIAAAAGLTSLAVGAFSKGDDVMSEGGYGNRTLLTPKGSIALNNNDTVIAGTNLGGKGNSRENLQQQQDNSALIAEIRAMRQEQAKSNSKPTVIENSVNGTRFGTAVAMNTYKTA